MSSVVVQYVQYPKYPKEFDGFGPRVFSILMNGVEYVGWVVDYTESPFKDMLYEICDLTGDRLFGKDCAEDWWRVRHVCKLPSKPSVTFGGGVQPLSYWTKSYLEKLSKGFPRKKCECCGKPFTEDSPQAYQDDLIKRYYNYRRCHSKRIMDNEDFYVHTVFSASLCLRGTCIERYIRQWKQQLRQKLLQEKEVKCLKLQFKALQNWKRFRNPDVFKSLPPGYGLDRISH